jgi:hypothetical protein
LLAKVYGVGEMQPFTLFIFLPCCGLIVTIYFWSRRQEGFEDIWESIRVGFVGGLLGTLAYDLVRVPFMILGQRIYAPIQIYGVWISDAELSSRFTDVLGWAYHFSNGITFGIMYALFMRARHWVWGIVWGLALETLAILSPFGVIFSVRTNPVSLGIAYLGHIAYGYPLGRLVQRFQGTINWLDEIPKFGKAFATAILLLALITPLYSPERIASDRKAVAHEFIVQGESLIPGFLRIPKNASITVLNPTSAAVDVFNKATQQTLTIEPNGKITIPFDQTGIKQLYVTTSNRTRSSFVLVEPVEVQSP